MARLLGAVGRDHATWARWLVGAATLAVLGLTALLVIFYRVPWGGAFNRTWAGPVSEWVAALFTALGVLGLMYQLSQLRASRADETTREINSLFLSVSTHAWVRNATLPGILVHIYLTNDGERKAMDVQVQVQGRNGQTIPEDWILSQPEDSSALTLPPAMRRATRVLIVHVPRNAVVDFFGLVGNPEITTSWTDTWGRRITMTDNLPSRLLKQSVDHA